jgi:hypothetical protein
VNRQVATAALVYFLVVFAVGFVTGAIRVTAIEPRLGQVWSVALEIPLMLAVSWFVARWIVTRYSITDVGSALAVGVLGVVLLVIAETLLGLAFGQGFGDQVRAYGTARGGLTLAGQLGYALMPLIAWLQTNSSRSN